jgi:1-acyl-sn-glycerol-3-phosphate acyltransferase
MTGLAIIRWRATRMNAMQLGMFKQRWSLRMLEVVGVRLQAEAMDLPARSLIVSNHISWLDVFVISAVTHTHFVCKDEIRKWPYIGWFVAVTGTVFIARGSRSDAARTAKTLVERLQRNEQVAFFPEGTTTNGTKLLPFSAALFDAASPAGASVVPMALRYFDLKGQPTIVPAYDGDITFMECLHSIVRAPGIVAELRALPAIPPGYGRRAYAAMTHAQIADVLELPAD